MKRLWINYWIIIFRDPLSLEESKSGCNGNLENGHLEEDSVDPLDTTMTNGQCTGPSTIALKKKRKSSAEKFLEDQSEYYGFQVLPSKLRSSVENTTFETNTTTTTTPTTSTFLDCLHQLPLTKSKTKSNSGSSDTEAELTDEMGSAAKAVSKTIKQNLLTIFYIYIP